MQITEQDIARGTFEANHHATGYHKWLKATVVKVTTKFVDAQVQGYGVTRYHRDSGEQRGDYCGFKSTIRPVR